MTDLHLRVYEKGDEYKSEIGKYSHPRSAEALIVTAKHWGIKAGLEATEASMLVREIIH